MSTAMKVPGAPGTPSTSGIDLGLSTAARRLERMRGDRQRFERLAVRLRELTGINLATTEKSMSLMAARLARVIERHGLDGYDDYLELLAAGGREVVQEFICALTTNTTEFFREAQHFAWVTRVLPAYLRQIRAAGQGELRVWCAASSTGQEPYSILMTLLEAEPALAENRLRLLATDIDMDVLERASRGEYAESEMAGVPPIHRQRHFTRKPGRGGRGARSDEDVFVVNDELRRLCTFAPFNLMSDAYPFQRGFDLIFCRNVLIYFDRAQATVVTDKLGRSLVSGGHLIVGHSEVGIVRPGEWTSVANAVYRRGPG